MSPSCFTFFRVCLFPVSPFCFFPFASPPRHVIAHATPPHPRRPPPAPYRVPSNFCPSDQFRPHISAAYSPPSPIHPPSNSPRVRPTMPLPLTPSRRHQHPHPLKNHILARTYRLNPLKSNPYAKTRGWGSNHEFFHQIALLLLVCLFVLEIVGCAGALSSGSNSGTGSSTGGSTTVPALPTGLVVTAGNAQDALTWTASSGATSYHVKRSTTTGGPYTQVSAPTAASFTDTGLTNGTTYFYVVSAVNANGESANSAQASAKPTAPSQSQAPATPMGLTATPSNAQVSLTWAASTNATNYNVKRATVTGGPYTKISSPTATNFIDTGLTNGTTYFYVVSAQNSSGESANSAQASAKPAASTQTQIPATPTGLTAIAGNAQISLTWSISSGTTSYHLKRSTTTGGPYTQISAPTSHRLHRHRPHQRHEIFLRRLRREHRRRKCQLRAGPARLPPRLSPALPTSPSRSIPQTQNRSRPTSTA